MQIKDLLNRFFPNGTRIGSPNVNPAPFWPPDMFAFTATLLSLSGFYVRSRYTAQWRESCFFRGGYLRQVERIGSDWKTGGDFPNDLQDLWDIIVHNASANVSSLNVACCDTALKLMTIADEASEDIGFVAESSAESPFADFLLDQHLRTLVRAQGKKPGKWDLPFLPESLCWMVPPTEACVQPKTMTPTVGCTVRSFSHHLALLPPVGEIRTRWLFGFSASGSDDPTLNLLLVPYPFRIDGNCFTGESFPVDAEAGDSFNFFTIRQRWLEAPTRKKNFAALSKFLVELIRAAEIEVGKVHGLILPEGALESSQVRPLARWLASRTNLELFISGYIGSKGSNSALPENGVYTSVLHDHKMLHAWSQSKHHRWRIDRPQVARYHLGHALDPTKNWWEKIDLKPRSCNFYVFRHGASLAAMVCEDLARIEPVQAALRAVGPNLVVVLLMDGPQMEKRWPGKYATVLAEDPGSAVLTLTSLGMVKRSTMPGEAEARHVALWRDKSGGAQELKLPSGCHSLVLTLSSSLETCRSLDGRSDREETIRLTLSGVRGISHPRPPDWAHTGST